MTTRVKQMLKTAHEASCTISCLLHTFAEGASTLMNNSDSTAIRNAPSTGIARSRREPHPFDVDDLVMLRRVSDPVLSPAADMVAFTLRRTDYEANKGIEEIHLLALDTPDARPVTLAEGSGPAWSVDGKRLLFIAAADGRNQVWSVAASGGTPQQVTDCPVAVNNFRLSPDGALLALSIDVFDDAPGLANTRQLLDARQAEPASGHVYEQMFVRHWDTWADDRHSQLFVVPLDDTGRASGEPLHVSRGVHGDVPSKPFGDASEYVFSPDGSTLYFNARLATPDEPWSTDFDIYSVPVDASEPARNLTAGNPAWVGWPVPSPDGATLYYLAHAVPAFESDRFAIHALDLASGERREVAPDWDRSAAHLRISPDGKTLYATADDQGQHPLFAIDAISGNVRVLLAGGSISGFDVRGGRIVAARADLQRPADLYLGGHDHTFRMITQVNAETMQPAQVGAWEFFEFAGWSGETVQGYVVKPANFEEGRTYPVAFIIHGGPQGAMNNGWSYRWNAQTYAGQGFAVVAINFHGSTGYGQAFTDSISGDWGGKPLEDLQAGWAHALKRFDFLDGNRAAALGASYGGYMICWMSGQWNTPWKCFVNHDGVFDMRMMYYATEELWFDEHEHGAPHYQTPERYEAHNPVNHVSEWRVPTLVIQGGKDFRIPESQGLGAFTALQRQGIPSQFLYFPDENHWVTKPRNSVQWHRTVHAWLKRWTV